MAKRRCSPDSSRVSLFRSPACAIRSHYPGEKRCLRDFCPASEIYIDLPLLYKTFGMYEDSFVSDREPMEYLFLCPLVFCCVSYLLFYSLPYTIQYCIAVSVSIERNGGFLSDIILLTLCGCLTIGEPDRIPCEFLFWKPMYGSTQSIPVAVWMHASEGNEGNAFRCFDKKNHCRMEPKDL